MSAYRFNVDAMKLMQMAQAGPPLSPLQATSRFRVRDKWVMDEKASRVDTSPRVMLLWHSQTIHQAKGHFLNPIIRLQWVRMDEAVGQMSDHPAKHVALC